MNILILAPQSFFVERGTPIAVKMLTETLESMEKSKIDLITYHEGQDIKFKKARHYRALIPRWIKNIHPGISLKKLLADVFFSLFVFKHLALQKKKYDFIHAVEESVFIALAVKLITGKKYVYDMDSSIAEQSSDKWVFLKLIQFLLNFLENLAIKNARGVLPMCDALAKKAKLAGAKNVTTLRDISYYNDNAVITPDKNLRKTLNLKESDLLIL